MTAPTNHMPNSPGTIAELLAEATHRLALAEIDSPRLNAEVLLAHTMDTNRTALYAALQDRLQEEQVTRFEACLARRLQREPLQYLVGHQEFWSLDFIVTPDVLIPRPETERIVELALEAFPEGRQGQPVRVCDVGTGSGCLAIALASEWPAARITAVDVSEAALRVAIANAERCGVSGRISFVCSDLFEALDDRPFDLIVANPPYLSDAELAAAQPELAAEPRTALTSGHDGLSTIRRLLAQVRSRLVPGIGRFLMEIGAGQEAAVLSLAREAGFATARIEHDYAGLPRVLSVRV